MSRGFKPRALPHVRSRVINKVTKQVGKIVLILEDSYFVLWDKEHQDPNRPLAIYPYTKQSLTTIGGSHDTMVAI